MMERTMTLVVVSMCLAVAAGCAAETQEPWPLEGAR